MPAEIHAALHKKTAARFLQLGLPALIGLLLMVSSVFLPWLVHGGAERFTANMDRVATMLRLGDFAGWAPRLPQVLGVSHDDLKSGETLIEALARKESGFLCTALQEGDSFTGWTLGQHARQTNKALSAYMVVLATGTGLLLTLNLVTVFVRDPGIHRVVITVTSVFALAMLFGALWYLPVIDTLGARDDPALRLLMVAAEARVGGGVWLAMAGALVAIITTSIQWSAEKRLPVALPKKLVGPPRGRLLWPGRRGSL